MMVLLCYRHILSELQLSNYVQVITTSLYWHILSFKYDTRIM